MRQIPFNKPYITGQEAVYYNEVLHSRKLSGNGAFTKRCQQFFETTYGFKKCFLTSSCTDALEMSALLLDIQPGDEVIIPSYTFVSSANAFVLRGAKIIFADSSLSNPNIDVSLLESLITPKTKAILVVHYAGVAVDMDAVLAISDKHNLFVVEDAAHAVDSYYKGRPLGSLGHLATFSFHDTKNIVAGEGGMLVVNDERFIKRAEIIWEKGTNRAAFFRGEIDKYGWVDVGSSFLASEITASFLLAQLEHIQTIQQKRISIWKNYVERLEPLAQKGKFELPQIPAFATNNAHMFYIVLPHLDIRSQLITFLKSKGISAVFHYVPLHQSTYYQDKHDGRELVQTLRYGDCLLRLPLFFEMEDEDIACVTEAISEFFKIN